MHLVLFDVDGTLILTNGAGMRAFYRALEDVLGVDASRGLYHPDGKTDPQIARELLAGLDLSNQWTEEIRKTLFAAYLAFLEDEMRRAKKQGLIRILPGARNLLDLLVNQPDFCLGLVTGNLEKGARIKLEMAGLGGYFRFGGYGSDSENRTELTRIGIERGAQSVVPNSVEDAFVIGDTPLDIIHGHAAGARVIAVASSRYSIDELGMHDPDLLIRDLTPAESVVRFMRCGR
jgi:phosphoglycolate phosphatase